VTPKTIGRGDAYQIVSTIGRGGFATVYKAYHAALDRYVAIKVLRPEILEPEGALRRFQIEARASARLAGHPNIVTVYDYGEEDGAPYLVLQLVDGFTLERRLADPMSAAEASRIIDGVASALDFAHSHQLVHRDIKPSNVLLDDDGQIVLSDFGIAKLLDATSSLTVNLLGTPEYMSPEQIRGIELDGRSDVYSLGIMAYRMFAGRTPFHGAPMALLHQHVSEPPPPMASADRLIPPGVEDIVMRALAKDRDLRPSTAGQFASELAQALRPTILAERAHTALAAGNLSAAEALLDDLRRLYPAHPDRPRIEQEVGRRQALEAGRDRATALVEAGRWQEALDELEQLGLRGDGDAVTLDLIHRAEAGLAAERRAEADRRAEAERRAESQRRADAEVAERRAREERERQVEADRRAEAQRQAERRREGERQAEAARLAEAARVAEAARLADIARRAELERTTVDDKPDRPTRQTAAISSQRLDETTSAAVPARLPSPPSALATRQTTTPNRDATVVAPGHTPAASGERRTPLWPIAAVVVGVLLIVGLPVVLVLMGVLGSSAGTEGPTPEPTVIASAPTTQPAPTSPPATVPATAKPAIATPAPTVPVIAAAPTPAPPPTAAPATLAAPTAVPATPTSAPPPTSEPALATRIPWRDGVDMALVPAGAFTMGDNADPSTAPQFSLSLPALYLDLTEVTNARFATFVQQSGYQPKGDWRHYFDGQQLNPAEFDVDRKDHPVVNVTWDDASQYCRWAGKRLPTEAEWEKGARGTDGRRWPWGNDAHPDFANVETQDEDREPDTMRVGSLPQGASPFGLLDMIGNAREWTDSPLQPYPVDPTAPIPPDASTRVTRGASWLSLPSQTEIVRRLVEPPTTAAKDLGFRCAVSADHLDGR
jgi:formylglycine-generating enzyme required for sulfatase activity/tRNA A-37 threonylcarbamoyl transferase component Bud32